MILPMNVLSLDVTNISPVVELATTSARALAILSFLRTSQDRVPHLTFDELTVVPTPAAVLAASVFPLSTTTASLLLRRLSSS